MCGEAIIFSRFADYSGDDTVKIALFQRYF